MASVSELWGNVVSVTPVDGGLVGTGEAVSGVSGEGDGGDSAHDLGLTLDKHILNVDLSDSSIASTGK